MLALLSILKLLYDRQKIGAEVLDAEVMQLIGRDQSNQWAEFSKILHANELITRTEKEGMVLARNLDKVDFWTFYKTLPYPLPRREDMGKVTAEDRWIQVIGPALVQSDDYLSAKLAIPLSKVLDVE